MEIGTLFHMYLLLSSKQHILLRKVCRGLFTFQNEIILAGFFERSALSDSSLANHSDYSFILETPRHVVQGHTFRAATTSTRTTTTRCSSAERIRRQVPFDAGINDLCQLFVSFQASADQDPIIASNKVIQLGLKTIGIV